MNLSDLQPGWLVSFCGANAGILGRIIDFAEGGKYDPLTHGGTFANGIYDHSAKIIKAPFGQLMLAECGAPSCPDVLDGKEHFGVQISDLGLRLANSGARVSRLKTPLTALQISASWANWQLWDSPGLWGPRTPWSLWTKRQTLDYVPYAWGMLLPFDVWLERRRWLGESLWPLYVWPMSLTIRPPGPSWGSWCSRQVCIDELSIGTIGYDAVAKACAYSRPPNGVTPDDLVALDIYEPAELLEA